MHVPEEWPSCGSDLADRIRLTGPAATTFLFTYSQTLILDCDAGVTRSTVHQKMTIYRPRVTVRKTATLATLGRYTGTGSKTKRTTSEWPTIRAEMPQFRNLTSEAISCLAVRRVEYLPKSGDRCKPG